jgi:hypothetical protein
MRTNLLLKGGIYDVDVGYPEIRRNQAKMKW